MRKNETVFGCTAGVQFIVGHLRSRPGNWFTDSRIDTQDRGFCPSFPDTTVEHIFNDFVICLQSVIIKLCFPKFGFIFSDSASVTATRVSRP
ncbi:hypothetical protein T265_04360 [Opisthorchis viverrini]|uniref:Uncharacterized protein n=1 Tax=Opisthorchis viverrini TaxID=6198 RepID=A0A075A004_OPIVI|nr:hypothetical protein T265_04360 [Opisthorchis viverrini]KER28895.1 hypothetical protein T265_04360 [Opisthorchis viverrini]